LGGRKADFKQVNKCISVKNIVKISTMALGTCQYKCDTIISEMDGNYLRITYDGCITSLLIAFQDFLVSGVRGQMTEVRSQRTEDRSQRTESRTNSYELRVKDEKPERTERETRNAQPASNNQSSIANHQSSIPGVSVQVSGLVKRETR